MVRDMPLATSRAVTVTPGTTAPLWSRAMPVMVPLPDSDWAAAPAGAGK
jgi:hypothetical protein